MYKQTIPFEWNPNKAATNLKKHGIYFADAVSVFYDSLAITIDDPDFDEERFITIGMDTYARILVVVYTYRGKGIRLISAHKAEKHERKQYKG